MCIRDRNDPVFPNGCAVCECEVDPQTGAVALTRYAAVDDVGRCVNPLIVHGQTHGGIAQGAGQALGELCAMDDSGQPLAGTLMDLSLIHISEPTRLLSISYAVFCLKKK